MKKKKVTLFGASGTMGFEAFKELWSRKYKYDIILLLLPLKKEKKLFKKYEKKAGIKSIPNKGIVEGNGFKIIWGDATNYDDVFEACRGTDWVLDAMAYISPAADYYPETAMKVNYGGIKNIVKAIEAQPNGSEHIRLAYTGTVAETGDRLQNIRWGRTGDPLKPSIFDYYAVSKIRGEKTVLESNIKKWISLRMSYIMPTNWKKYMNLQDAIMFHMPLDSCMENISARDAGYGLINVLNIPDVSNFWKKIYNMGGGPKMRTIAYDYTKRSMKINGLSSPEAVFERKWFALRNFHMQYYEDSHILNDYLHYWRDSMDDWEKALVEDMPLSLKIVKYICNKIPAIQKFVEKKTYSRMKKLVENHKNGTAYWYSSGNNKRITAFYKNTEIYESIPDWGEDEPWKLIDDGKLSWDRLDHGFDEDKKLLDLKDLQKAAEFRGGKCISEKWGGNLFEKVEFECVFGHKFLLKPNTVLKGGHWCQKCTAPPWKFDEIAKNNKFFAQVWYPNHGKDENNVYTKEDCEDIAGADIQF